MASPKHGLSVSFDTNGGEVRNVLRNPSMKPTLADMGARSETGETHLARRE
jgi:hypothetical protein